MISAVLSELPSPRTFADWRKAPPLSHAELYLLTSDVARRAPRCLVYIHDSRVYNLVGAGSDLQRDQGDAFI